MLKMSETKIEKEEETEPVISGVVADDEPEKTTSPTQVEDANKATAIKMDSITENFES